VISSINRDLLHEYKTQFDDLLAVAPFTLNKQQKEAKLGALLTILHGYHSEHCASYRKIHQKIQLSPQVPTLNTRIAEQPFLAVRLFKQRELSSIAPENIFKVLRSSGTTGQVPAKVLLDKETSARQSKVLVNILQNILGKQRIPMLVIDAESVARGRGHFSARTAGIQGLSFFGRKHVYALNEDMSPNWTAVDEFFHQHGEGPVLIFGFTFMIWQYLIEAAIREGKRFSAKKALIIHSGGWKKLVSKAVDNTAFKAACDRVVQGSQVHSFYGMAEQVGSIFIECEQGHLHAPNMADIIIRQANDLSECMIGETGLIQVVSAIPTSYPGHSILTEDLGKMIGEDDCKCGRLGKYFEVLGRIPKVEVRGCSDTHE
jgi:phenylacetate-coenzyme A ligase PaaK-like adenylate-forming protein